jgi:hypothetical protein
VIYEVISQVPKVVPQIDFFHLCRSAMAIEDLLFVDCLRQVIEAALKVNQMLVDTTI